MLYFTVFFLCRFALSSENLIGQLGDRPVGSGAASMEKPATLTAILFRGSRAWSSQLYRDYAANAFRVYARYHQCGLPGLVRQAQATNVSLPAAPSLYWKMSRTSSEAVNSVICCCCNLDIPLQLLQPEEDYRDFSFYTDSINVRGNPNRRFTVRSESFP
jgi:hypothetical protein